MNSTAADDDFLFDGDDDSHPPREDDQGPPWKIMIVDDAQEIHEVTLFSLQDIRFLGRPLQFVHAYTGTEAVELLREHPDTAMVLLDVVMETDHAGLEVARRIREELEMSAVRIVLRTGQPGQAPERDVITNYDINDYKEKTELTSKKLYTVVCSSLRAYKNIEALEANRKGLRKIIDASNDLYKENSLEQFSQGALRQLTAMLHLKNTAYYSVTDGMALQRKGKDLHLLASAGRFERFQNADNSNFPPETQSILDQAIRERRNIYGDNCMVAYHESEQGHCNLLYACAPFDISGADHELLELYTRNVGTAFEKMELRNEIEQTQREIVYLLGETVETRSQETGNHVKRVAEISKLLALAYGINAYDAEILKLASPLHDIGKIGIPDAILNKPGKHTPQEWEIMQTHAQLGYALLRNSRRPVMQAGAHIAHEHHEKWDGSGYPRGLAQKKIHPFARITALADVFDALGSERCYKKAWPMERILDLLREESGRHFEPKLVELFFGHLPEIQEIREIYQDDFRD